MRVYKKGETYFWEVDRFHFFTESEKSGILEALKEQYKVWKIIEEEQAEEHGVAEMLNNLIKECEESL